MFELVKNGEGSIMYSPKEKELFKLLPTAPKRISSTELMKKKYRAAMYGRHSVISTMRSLSEKVRRNKEPFRIGRTERSGPYPVFFWIEPVAHR